MQVVYLGALLRLLDHGVQPDGNLEALCDQEGEPRYHALAVRLAPHDELQVLESGRATVSAAV